MPSRRRGLLLVLLVATGVLFANLGGYELWDPDEAKHAEIAREVFESGRWWAPTINYEPYHHKPSLFYLLVSGCYSLFGVNEVSARLVPAASCLLTLLCLYLYASSSAGSRVQEREGRTETALLASLMLLGSYMFPFVGRFTNFDSLVTAALSAAVFYLAWWMEQEDRSWGVWPFYVFTALATLIKGPMAVVLVGAPLSLMLLRGELSLKRVAPISGTLIVLAMLALWVVPVWLKNPDYLVDFLWIHNVQRYVSGSKSFHPQPFYFFFPVLIAGLLPWSAFVPKALRRSLDGTKSERWLSYYVLWVFIFFSLSRGKLATYVLPSFPVFAVIVARWLSDRSLGKGRPRAIDRWMLGLSASVLLLLVPVSFLLLRHEVGSGEFDLYSLTFLPASLSGAWILASLVRNTGPSSTESAITVLATGTVATVMVFNLWGARAVSVMSSDADLARAVNVEENAAAVLYWGVRPFSFQFYTRRPLVLADGGEACQEALGEGGMVVLLTKDKRINSLPASFPSQNFHEWVRNGRHVLLTNRPM